jgi:hypothetical protein
MIHQAEQAVVYMRGAPTFNRMTLNRTTHYKTEYNNEL